MSVSSEKLLQTVQSAIPSSLKDAASQATSLSTTSLQGNKAISDAEAAASSKIGQIAQETQTAGMDLLKDINNLATLSEKDFPQSDSIMGLPPIGTSGSEEDFSVYEQLVSAFPILTLQPFKMFGVKQEGKFDREVLSVIYKFAVIPTTDVTYGHSNQYGPSSIAQTVEQLMNSETMGQLRQLAFVSGGPLGNAFRAGASTTTEAINQTLKALYASMPANVKNNPIGGPMAGVGMDVLRGLLLGARAAFPNIWQSSQTGMSWTFNVELRTFSTDPTSDQYKKDILLPLECLLSLSLPVGGSQIAYTEPPYIKAKIPNVLNVEIGAVSNMQWSIPLSELNFAGVPRHIQITITITDLYNVMVQGADVTKNNVDIPTRDRMLSWIGQTASKKVANAQIWKNEFMRPGGGLGNLETVPEGLMSSETLSASWSSIGGMSSMAFFSSENFGDSVLSGFGETNFNMMFNPASGFLNMSIPNLNDFTALSIPNVTDIMGDLDIMSMMNGNMASFNLDDFNVFLASAAPISLEQFSTLGSATSLNLQNLFNGFGNMSKITDGLMSMVPSNMFSNLGAFNQNMITEIFNSADSSLLDFSDHFGIVNGVVDNMYTLLPSLLSDIALDEDNFIKNVTTYISKNNTQLDNQLRLSTSLQETLYRSCGSIISDVFNNSDIVDELKYINSEMRNTYGGAEIVVPQFNTAMKSFCKAARSVMTTSATQNIMSNGLRTNNRSCGILVEAKS